LLREDILVADHSTCLCIVSRDRLRGNDFIAALGASMRPHEQLEIIVDRRSGEPSDDWDPTQDRRRRPQVDLALKANGFAVVPAPSPGGRRTPTSLLVPSAPSSDGGFDGGFDDGDDDEERLEAIRSFKRERSSNLVPWLIAVLAALAAAAFILSPTGHAIKQTVAQHMSTDTTSSSSATGASSPPAPTPPSNPAPAPQARPPVVADKPPAADAPARAPAAETPQVDRPLRGPASPPEPAPPREAARVDPSRDAGAPTFESNGSPGSSTAPGAARRSRATETARPSTSTPVPRQTAVAPPPSEPVSRSVSPRFAGLPRVELSREASSSSATYSARIVDPAGKPLPDAEVLLLARMPDGTVENVRMDFYPDRGTYRGSLPTASSPVDIRVRVITGDKRVEIPLGP
jgi:cell division protein FtsN